MKRWIAAALVLMALVSAGSIWQTKTELTGADMAVEIPQGWTVLTRDMRVLQRQASGFGMTAEEALNFLTREDIYMVLYHPETDAEMYVTIFGSGYAAQCGELADLTEEEAQRVREETLGTTARDGWILDGGIADRTLGSFLYYAASMHLGEGAERLDNRQLVTFYDGLEIYIDLYAGADGMTEELERAQDTVAESLEVEWAFEQGKKSYYGYVAMMLGLMATLLIQFTGLAMTVLLYSRMKTK